MLDHTIQSLTPLSCYLYSLLAIYFIMLYSNFVDIIKHINYNDKVANKVLESIGSFNIGITCSLSNRELFKILVIQPIMKLLILPIILICTIIILAVLIFSILVLKPLQILILILKKYE